MALQNMQASSSNESKSLPNTRVQEAKERLDHLKVKIARLSSAAKEAEQERDALQKFIDSQGIVLPPVRRVPLEILSTIFLSVSEGHYDVFNVRAGPWALSRICSHWRSAALSLPGIWSYMAIPAFNRSGGNLGIPKSPASLLERALQLSAQCGLSIRLEHDADFRAREDLLDALINHGGRWKDVDLSVPASFFHQTSRRLGPLQLLSSLKLRVVEVAEQPEAAGPHDLAPANMKVFGNAPQLRSICLEGISHPEQFELPWIQMTSIELGLVSKSALVDLLYMAPDLQVLKLRLDDDSPAAAPSAPLVHKSLHTLSLCGEGVTIPTNLTLPFLRDVTISGGFELESDTECLLALSDLLVRSNSPLKRLSLIDVNLLEGFTGVLESAPELTELRIRLTKYDEEHDTMFNFIMGELLEYRAPHACTIPQLEVLELSIDWDASEVAEYRTVDFVSAAFCDVIDSRRSFTSPNPPVATLRRVHIEAQSPAEYPNLVDDVDFPKLQAHKANGLDISIRTTDKAHL